PRRATRRPRRRFCLSARLRSLDRRRIAAPPVTIVKRTAGLKPKFDAEMLSACAVLQKWAFSGHFAAALHLAENGRTPRIFLATHRSRRRAGRIDSTSALVSTREAHEMLAPSGRKSESRRAKTGSISGEGRGEHDRV